MTDNDVCHFAETLDLSAKKKSVAATIEIEIIQNVTPTKSLACKSAAKRKFKVWPSAYASGWGVRCTKAGGPSKFGGGKK